MDWPVATVLLGTIGTLAVGILKLVPRRDGHRRRRARERPRLRPCNRPGRFRARLVSLEQAHHVLRAEIRADIKELQTTIRDLTQAFNNANCIQSNYTNHIMQIRDRIKELRRVRADRPAAKPAQLAISIRRRNKTHCEACSPKSATPVPCSPANSTMERSCSSMAICGRNHARCRCARAGSRRRREPKPTRFC